MPDRSPLLRRLAGELAGLAADVTLAVAWAFVLAASALYLTAFTLTGRIGP